VNNIESAKATMFDLYADINGGPNHERYPFSWSKSMFDAIDDFNEKAQYTHVSARAQREFS